jgi:hypothetical protein
MVRQIRWRRIERPVVDHAASERRVLPVNAKGNAQGACSFVDAVAWKYHDRRRTRDDRLRAEDPVHHDVEFGRLFLTRFEDVRAVVSNRSLSVDPRKAQPGSYASALRNRDERH